MSNEAPYQVNFKTPKGALINIRAWSELELDQGLDAILSRVNVINDVELSIEAVCNLQQGGIKVTETVVSNPAPSVNPAPAVAGAPVASSTPVCDHGQPMRYVPAGISKAGKPFKGFYACSMPREQQCAAKA